MLITQFPGFSKDRFMTISFKILSWIYKNLPLLIQILKEKKIVEIGHWGKADIHFCYLLQDMLDYGLLSFYCFMTAVNLRLLCGERQNPPPTDFGTFKETLFFYDEILLKGSRCTCTKNVVKRDVKLSSFLPFTDAQEKGYRWLTNT